MGKNKNEIGDIPIADNDMPIIANFLAASFTFDIEKSNKVADEIEISARKTLNLVTELAEMISQFEVQAGQEVDDLYKVDKYFLNIDDLIAELSREVHNYISGYFAEKNQALKTFGLSREIVLKILQDKFADSAQNKNPHNNQICAE